MKWIIILIPLFFASYTFGQESQKNAIRLTHPKGKKVLNIQTGQRLVIKRVGRETKERGFLREVTSEYLILNDEKIPLDSIYLLGANPLSGTVMRTAGVVVTAPLLIVGLAQILIGVNALTEWSDGSGNLYLVGGVMDISFGTLWTYVALSPYNKTNKRYKKGSGWTMEILEPSIMYR